MLTSYDNSLESVQVPGRTVSELRLMSEGLLEPLGAFMGERDYRAVLGDMRLADGRLFPFPLVLPLEEPSLFVRGKPIVLRDPQNIPVAVVTLQEMFERDRDLEAATLGPAYSVIHGGARYYGAGPVHALGREQQQLAWRESIPDLPHRANGKVPRLAYYSKFPAGEFERDRLVRLAQDLEARLLLALLFEPDEPASEAEMSRLQEFDDAARQFPQSMVSARVISAPSYGAGVRELYARAILARSSGATHLGVAIATEFPGLRCEEIEQASTVIREGLDLELVRIDSGAHTGSAGFRTGAGSRNGHVSGSAFGEPVGVCIWLTGLPSSGKSTLAEIVRAAVLSRGRTTSVLDGDVVRTHLSKGLGFSREDRDTNILRIGFVASEIVRHRGVVICAAVSPYRATRDRVRAMFPSGQFVEVFVDAPLALCEQRDRKGFYAQARAGQISNFTGVQDPYEPPLTPDITIRTESESPEDSADHIVRYLERHGFLSGPFDMSTNLVVGGSGAKDGEAANHAALT
jgi:sulfate adenylyltransferase